MPNIPKKLLNAAIKSQTALDQFGHHLNARVQGLLKTAENEIAGRVAAMDPTAPNMTAWKLQRLTVLNEQIGAILKQTYGAINRQVNGELQAAGKLQADNVVQSFNKAVGVDLFTVTLTPENIRDIVKNTLIDGKIIGAWWAKQSADLQARIGTAMKAGMQAIRTGLVQGESVGELIGRIRGTKTTPGVMSLTKREATALVRTSVMQVANAVRQETYKANADVLDGFEWISALDNRTTLGCMALDGKRFDMEMNPVGHDITFPGIPRHWNCRSVLVPITKSWADLTGPKSPLRDEKIEQLKKSIPAGQRASINGPLPAQTYDEWLRDQSKETQLEILGPGRFDLWKRKKLDMADLVNNRGNPIPLEELKRRLKQ